MCQGRADVEITTGREGGTRSGSSGTKAVRVRTRDEIYVVTTADKGHVRVVSEAVTAAPVTGTVRPVAPRAELTADDVLPCPRPTVATVTHVCVRLLMPVSSF